MFCIIYFYFRFGYVKVNLGVIVGSYLHIVPVYSRCLAFAVLAIE